MNLPGDIMMHRYHLPIGFTSKQDLFPLTKAWVRRGWAFKTRRLHVCYMSMHLRILVCLMCQRRTHGALIFLYTKRLCKLYWQSATGRTHEGTGSSPSGTQHVRTNSISVNTLLYVWHRRKSLSIVPEMSTPDCRRSSHRWLMALDGSCADRWCQTAAEHAAPLPPPCFGAFNESIPASGRLRSTFGWETYFSNFKEIHPVCSLSLDGDVRPRWNFLGPDVWGKQKLQLLWQILESNETFKRPTSSFPGQHPSKFSRCILPRLFSEIEKVLI